MPTMSYWAQLMPTIPATATGEAVIMPLAGPAVLMSALAGDALTLRRGLDPAKALLGG